MKITILANRDLASCLALNRLIPELQVHELTVFLSARVGGSASQSPSLELLHYYEQQLFNDTVFPLAEALSSPTAELLSFGGLGKYLVKPVENLEKINSEGLENYLGSEPDLVLSIRYGGILKERVIAAPEYGVLNLHSGLLPDYRGVMATFRALLNGADHIGTTLHYIDDGGIDTGRIVTTTSMPISPSQTYLWHVLKLYQQGCETMITAVKQLQEFKTLECQSQSSGGNYFSFPDEEELNRFFSRGFALVDADHIASVAKRFYG